MMDKSRRKIMKKKILINKFFFKGFALSENIQDQEIMAVAGKIHREKYEISYFDKSFFGFSLHEPCIYMYYILNCRMVLFKFSNKFGKIMIILKISSILKNHP